MCRKPRLMACHGSTRCTLFPTRLEMSADDRHRDARNVVIEAASPTTECYRQNAGCLLYGARAGAWAVRANQGSRGEQVAGLVNKGKSTGQADSIWPIFL